MEEVSCSGKLCNSPRHGDIINAAMSKHALSDNEIASFVNFICKNCGTAVDIDGKTALHTAASCGRTDVCRWLICQKQAKIEYKDFESGYTPLHRSLLYGKLDTAVALVQLGANLQALDANDVTPTDLLSQFQPRLVNGGGKSLIYAWGHNSNYTLGPNSGKKSPDLMDIVHRSVPEIEPRQILLEKYHTVITTMQGAVYSFGNGQGGRLGLDTEKTILEPAEIKFKMSEYPARVQIKMTAIARNHCLFLSESAEVWSCGSNTHHVLGLNPPPTQLLSPKLLKLKNILGIACGCFHSIAWNEHTLYTWGYNGGQLGHDIALGKFITTPKAITCLSFRNRKIICAAASNGATAIGTDKGDVYLLHEDKSRTIASRVLELQDVKLYGGRVAGMDEKWDDLKLLALMKSGKIFVWQSTDNNFCRCVFSLARSIDVRQTCLNASGLVIVSTKGELFKGRFCQRRRKVEQTMYTRRGGISANHFLNLEDLKLEDCVRVKLERVPKIYKVCNVSSDLEGQNFAALITNPIQLSTCDVAPSTIQQDIARMQTEENLGKCIGFRVNTSTFRIHSYIVAMHSEILAAAAADKELVDVSHVEPEIFGEIVDYMYQGVCSLMKVGAIPEKFHKFCSSSTKKKGEISDPVRLLQEAAKRFGVGVLYKLLNGINIEKGQICIKQDDHQHLKLNPDDFPEFQDVAIVASCGGKMRAHKCVLGVRSEFFMNRFAAHWAASDQIQLPAPLSVVQDLVEYMYTDKIHLEGKDMEHILHLLVLADHILLDRLVQICECALRKMMTIRNVLQLFAFADMHNAELLKTGCMEVVCSNLALFLELQTLENLPENLLKDLTHFYEAINHTSAYRPTAPIYDCVKDEDIQNAHIIHPVTFNFDEIVKVDPDATPSSGIIRHQRRRIRNTHHNSPANCEKHDECLNEKSKEILDENRNGDDEKPQRISAICKAQAILQEEAAALWTQQNFPDLNSSFEKSPRTPKQKEGKMIRLSQRERKRLTSLTSPAVSESDSFVVEEESPKSCWHVDCDSPRDFETIVNDERQLKQNYHRMQRKLLLHTQIEEEAIKDLQNFYNVQHVNDEIISVHRVLDMEQVGTPLWVVR